MLNIGGLHQGVVIDHIQAGAAMKIYEYLNLDEIDACVAIIKNAKSNKMGKKDIIKIDSSTHINMDVIGFVDPQATVNIIRDGQLVRKRCIDMPAVLTNVIRCMNPRCITTTEQELDHVFKLTDPDNKIYRCIYCETKAERKY